MENKNFFTTGDKIILIIISILLMFVAFGVYTEEQSHADLYKCSSTMFINDLNSIALFVSIISLGILIVFVIISLDKPDDYFRKIFIKGCLFGIVIPIVLYISAHVISGIDKCEAKSLDSWMTIESKENKVIRV